jgi:hypothetical protein
MASGIYTSFLEYSGDATVDLDGHQFKVALMNQTHSFSAANTIWANVSANEITGTGYTAGGLAFTSGQITWTASGTTMKWDIPDASWATASFTAYHAVIYDDDHASDALMCSVDFGGAQTVSAGTFTIQWNSAGVLNSYAA